MLLSPSEIHENMTIQLDNKICKVISCEMHGTGQTGRIFIIKAKSIPDGHTAEKRLRAEEKVSEIKLDRVDMEFSYRDPDFFYFYDPASFETVPVTQELVGDLAPFLKEGSKIQMEYFEEKPVNVIFPQTVELKVARCAEPARSEQDSTMKEAEMENGITVLVPQFIKQDDVLKIDVAKRKFIERKKEEKEKK